MSTEGTAAVAGLPVAVAGAPVIGLGVLVAGTGILVAQGIMWCYEKLEENYRSACQSYANLAEAASQEAFVRQQDRYPLLVAAVNQFTTAPHLRAASGAAQSAQATATPDPRLQEEANAALARAQTALRSSADAQQVREEAERAILRRQLEAEIAASQHILPAQVIASARLTLDQSSANMRAALDALSSAWKAINDSHQHRAHQEQQARVILGNVRQQVFGIQTLAQQHLAQTDASFAQRLHDITDRVKRAEKFLASDPTTNDPKTALQVAQEAQKLAQDLEGRLASEVLSRWDEQHKLLLAQHGRLKALADVLKDTRAIALVPAAQLDPLARKLKRPRHSSPGLSRQQPPEYARCCQRFAPALISCRRTFFNWWGPANSSKSAARSSKHFRNLASTPARQSRWAIKSPFLPAGRGKRLAPGAMRNWSSSTSISEAAWHMIFVVIKGMSACARRSASLMRCARRASCWLILLPNSRQAMRRWKHCGRGTLRRVSK